MSFGDRVENIGKGGTFFFADRGCSGQTAEFSLALFLTKGRFFYKIYLDCILNIIVKSSLMPPPNNHTDYILAQKICHELKAENHEAICELYSRYQPLFFNFTRQRSFDSNQDRIETILNNFWVKLLDGKAICSYEGRASLRTFLLGILRRRIIDENRKIQRGNGNLQDDKIDPDILKDTDHGHSSPEEELASKEREKLVHEALMKLAEISPRDADLIRMHLDELSYKQMAERELAGKNAVPEEIARLADSIKKQFSRKRTGSKAKFKIMIIRLMEKNCLRTVDLLN